MQKYKNFSMRCIFLYLFICYLTTLIPLIEYAQRKGDQEILKTLAYKFIYLFILLFLYKFWALHMPPPHARVIDTGRACIYNTSHMPTGTQTNVNETSINARVGHPSFYPQLSVITPSPFVYKR
jgi:hypothetical protein